MKKIVASVGMVALGASGLQAQLTVDSGKIWSVSARLRGFYDDNINTAASGPFKQEAFGFEISPSIGARLSLPQTTIYADYTYSFKYYDHQPANNTEKYNQSHIFNFGLDHSFSPRYQLSLRDAFTIGQEPDILRAGNDALHSLQTISGDNIVNYAAITFDAKLTPLFGLEVGYANSIYDYDNHGAQVNTDPLSPEFGNVVPSLSGTLDRMAHTINLDSKWFVLPQTTGIFGYSFSQVNFTGDEQISGIFGDPSAPRSDSRDYREHRVYVGAEQRLSRTLAANLRIGGYYVDYYNQPGSLTDWGPYVEGSVNWSYAPESFLEAGIKHDVSTTDAGFTGSNFTTSADSTSVYAKVFHRLMPKLYGNLTGQFQYSEFNGGNFDGDSERLYLVGLNIEYRFNPNFSAEIGYDYDKQDSDIAERTFDRNRVYIGVKAGY